jgi:N-acetylglucosaminyldiphosphoundecaprenol N-acetyl-beta-D-mannosaminyltransferase
MHRADSSLSSSTAAPLPAGCINALSFDIEEWFHVPDVPAVADSRDWVSLPSQVEQQTELILQIIQQAGVRATFFVVGWVAERHPRLVRRLAAAGYEIATHSYWHRAVDRQTQSAFREDLKRSIEVLQDLAGTQVLGFRAPEFSLTQAEGWAFEVLLDLGLQYDASLIPGALRACSQRCPDRPHLFDQTPSGRAILELPASVLQLGRWRMRFCGAGYLRLMPKPLLCELFRYRNHRNQPCVIYLHPRDLARHLPSTYLPPLQKFRYLVGVRSTAGKLITLLRSFPFDTCAAVLGLAAPAGRAPPMPPNACSHPADFGGHEAPGAIRRHLYADETRSTAPKPLRTQKRQDSAVVEVGGVELLSVDLRAATDLIMRRLTAGQGSWIITVNLEILRQASSDPALMHLIRQADFRTADGITLVWASRLRRSPLPQRLCGSDLMLALSAAAATSGRSLFLLGGAPGMAAAAAAVLEQSCPGLRVAGTNGLMIEEPGDTKALEQVRAEIRQAQPDMIFVGMGFPKQDLLIEHLRAVCPNAVWMGVGISFSYICGTIRRPSPALQQLGGETLFRLCQEPRRLARRYLWDGPPFAARLLLNAIVDSGATSGLNASGVSSQRDE